MDEKTICNVRNRSSSRVCYVIPEDGIRREFAPGEAKKISFQELEQLSYQPGGREIMTHFLQIQSQEAVDNLGLQVEPEYNMTEEQIKDLILKGSLDEFLDCLDFAPTGVIDLIKTFAVQMPLNDIEKCKAIKEKTQNELAMRNAQDGIRIVVGMATCGIAAGARPVLSAFVSGVNEANLSDKVSVQVIERACASSLFGCSAVLHVYAAAGYIQQSSSKNIAVLVAYGGKLRPLLDAPGVERRVDVDEIHAGVRQFAEHGKIIGMETFGESAPAGKLFAKYGFTVENVVKAAKEVVGK